jgi:hypothetical protein
MELGGRLKFIFNLRYTLDRHPPKARHRRQPTMSQPQNLVPAIRASLSAKIERALQRPIIARIVNSQDAVDALDEDHIEEDRWGKLMQAIGQATRPKPIIWHEHHDGTCSVQIHIDYDDVWQGSQCEKEILDAVSNTVDGEITLLTAQQKTLLERSPREFLALFPRPNTIELIAFEQKNIGGNERVVGLTFPERPAHTAHIQYVAIVPNLIPLQRQLAALHELEKVDEIEALNPLRALVGLCDSACLHQPNPHTIHTNPTTNPTPPTCDEHQRHCIDLALNTPHFAVIQGPPGSGKTTVISEIIQQSLARKERILVVSPTHVAVDNVVEKITQIKNASADTLEPHSLVTRYAAKNTKLSPSACQYWVGRNTQHRAATISRRLQLRLIEMIPSAAHLYKYEDPEITGHAPLSTELSRAENIICGTPIGILSHEPVKTAPPAHFDLLIVDEVSKMTLPEFLAIAVKARRWVLVGDPQQLPPYNDCTDNAVTLNDVLTPEHEVICSIGAFLERAKPEHRRAERLVVIVRSPASLLPAIQEHIHQAFPHNNHPPISLLNAMQQPGIIICSPDEVNEACKLLSPAHQSDRSHNPNCQGSLRLLVERGLTIPRPPFASGLRLLEERERAQAQLFETSFNTYHTQPWSRRSTQRLGIVGLRNGLHKYLPAQPALIQQIAKRFAINTISVYEWLTGIPCSYFDVSPLREIAQCVPLALIEAVQPFVGTLKNQYRMHPSLSQIPRKLFYFGEALHDAPNPLQRNGSHKENNRVCLMQVENTKDEGELNSAEVERICDILEKLNQMQGQSQKAPEVMIITPYRKQEEALRNAVEKLQAASSLRNLLVESCTLDRCQGREADFVLISLVRKRATRFLDMPKRWNVALTRAKEGLFIIGNLESYLNESARKPPHSLLSYIICAYRDQKKM